jgi:NAD(P)H-dependent nitrite reductase small subunit
MSDPTTSRWVAVGAATALRADGSTCVTVEGLELAVFALPDGWAAIDNSCPHQGGALAEGVLANGRVTCPWHGWSFDVRTGACHTVPEDRIRAYPVREREGKIEIQLP